jgi:hypothetical protein|tara:strand:+ start:371 stop:475 length:105 start_codon:yes stop_codon:yes gene_type:complete
MIVTGEEEDVEEDLEEEDVVEEDLEEDLVLPNRI